ncbi:MAG: hypothetical protein WKF71_10620 [Pyrinomonadaceae bacterium]
MTDTALRSFKRGTIVRYGFEIYNAKLASAQRPQLQTQTKIFRDGKLFLKVNQSLSTLPDKPIFVR